MTTAGFPGYLEGLGRFGSRLGLERMAYLLEGLGHPERRLRVIHVAGTNGKGSVSAMLTSVLRAAGYRTGLYTSPHLQYYGERIRLDGAAIPPARLDSLVATVKEVADAAAARGLEPPTEFEAGTALMYLYFAEERADLVVQETGLGGRLDATNLVERPLVSVITPVDFDHMDRLGATLADIAREKAGIIKPGAPVVMGPQHPEAAAVIAAVSESAGAPLIRTAEDVQVEPLAVSAEGSRFDYHGLGVSWRRLSLGLPGRHQLANAACALAAIEILRRLDLAVPEQAVREGLARVRWPGRLELVQGSPAVVLDGAHNPAGLRALRAALDELFRCRRTTLVFGMLADKDVTGAAAALAGFGGEVVATRPDSPRALDPGELASILKRHGITVFAVEPDPVRAVRLALERAGPDDLVVVAGSLYLVGGVRGIWQLGDINLLQ